AVVNDDEGAAAVAVGVGVLLRGPAVRLPAGVADAEGPLDLLEAQALLEIAQLAGAAHHLDGAAVDDRDAGGVVAAVLEAAEAVEEDAADLLRTDVADDSAHGGVHYSPGACSVARCVTVQDPARDTGAGA